MVSNGFNESGKWLEETLYYHSYRVKEFWWILFEEYSIAVIERSYDNLGWKLEERDKWTILQRDNFHKSQMYVILAQPKSMKFIKSIKIVNMIRNDCQPVSLW